MNVVAVRSPNLKSLSITNPDISLEELDHNKRNFLSLERISIWGTLFEMKVVIDINQKCARNQQILKIITLREQIN